ncbi:MAG: 23S rRNA (pseudouridine(1915)-N(3))-methyltransferase RlmH [Clostridia bacterium]|nr:23S rRNA (pseudouridine(1915)-N(3))-methyltransferase RlmH [Clostridia bacterium]
MPNVTVISVGKIKEKAIKDALSEYEKRLSRFVKFKSIEISDRPIPDNASPSEEQSVLEKEGADILSKINKGDVVIALCIEGKKLSSVQFAKKISDFFMTSSSLTFIIGGSLGLSQAVKDRSDFNMSMSDMTFPHNLARLMLTEQIYRAFKINSNESYHK